jgi:5-methylcytosine-specific restriction endonuclease McrA
MRAYSLSHLSDPELIRGLSTAVAQHHITTATLLAYIAEVDDRRLYVPAGYPSMYAYCVGELHMSEDAAYKRIRAARAAREFPTIFEAVADGRLHLTAVSRLAPYLTSENAADLLVEACDRTKAQIEELLARRFPGSESLGLMVALPTPSPRGDGELVPEPVPQFDCETPRLAPAQVGPPSKVAPVAAERFLIQATVGRATQEKLCYIEDLLGHELPSGDLAQVLDQSFDALIEKLEKRKFAATRRPRRSRRPSNNPRHIPAHVKRAVWARDGGQCTFVSERGHRCEARKLIEFDHVEPVARGGTATVAGIRLRCRAHNQYAAERAFGAGFMREKREASQRAAAQRQEAARAAADEVIAPLRSLGFSAAEARSAAALCEAIPDAPLEHRVRRALTYFRLPRGSVTVRPGAGSC